MKINKVLFIILIVLSLFLVCGDRDTTIVNIKQNNQSLSKLDSINKLNKRYIYKLDSLNTVKK